MRSSFDPSGLADAGRVCDWQPLQDIALNLSPTTKRVPCHSEYTVSSIQFRAAAGTDFPASLRQPPWGLRILAFGAMMILRVVCIATWSVIILAYGYRRNTSRQFIFQSSAAIVSLCRVYLCRVLTRNKCRTWCHHGSMCCT